MEESRYKNWRIKPTAQKRCLQCLPKGSLVKQSFGLSSAFQNTQTTSLCRVEVISIIMVKHTPAHSDQHNSQQESSLRIQRNSTVSLTWNVYGHQWPQHWTLGCIPNSSSFSCSQMKSNSCGKNVWDRPSHSGVKRAASRVTTHWKHQLSSLQVVVFSSTSMCAMCQVCVSN